MFVRYVSVRPHDRIDEVYLVALIYVVYSCPSNKKESKRKQRATCEYANVISKGTREEKTSDNHEEERVFWGVGDKAEVYRTREFDPCCSR